MVRNSCKGQRSGRCIIIMSPFGGSVKELSYCKECKSKYYKVHKKHLFCSALCKQRDNRRKLFVIVSCSNCERVFSANKYDSQRYENHFCSRSCESEFRERNSNDIRICETCQN